MLNYELVTKYVKKLVKENKITTFAKCQDGLYEGRDFLYSTLEQAIASIFVAPFVIPIFIGNKMALITYYNYKQVKTHSIKINIYKNSQKLRQNIYYKTNAKPISEIKLTKNGVDKILSKILFDKKLIELAKF